ncbi:winged helix-turn-helix transcriptional regulator [Nocardiopsis sp. HNM0947]|uniref:Winged helix-turn-helix transcriptional regulator n=1 Tax=Nocardiopsis coralli TaxID=2772213 RepID=A0ABR9P0W1_9ACTN|nr:winged helix-turn-helix domain-containing protein [Nocardiopsis coralli]MBE2997468.1 winged helix-turn-helix transcriptional regulator [Nocardiopsis coralli]
MAPDVRLLERGPTEAVADPAGVPLRPLRAGGSEQMRVLGVVPLQDQDKLMVVVGHLVDAGARAAGVTEAPVPEHLGDEALSVDLRSRTVRVRGEQVDLCYQEFELLALMAASPGRVFTRRELAQEVWGADVSIGSRTVDVHVHRIRRKLGSLRTRVGTVRRVGYTYREL